MVSKKGADLKLSETHIEKTAHLSGGIFSTLAGWAKLLMKLVVKGFASAGLSFGGEKALKNREIKFDVAWSYVKRQTAKMTSAVCVLFF